MQEMNLAEAERDQRLPGMAGGEVGTKIDDLSPQAKISLSPYRSILEPALNGGPISIRRT